MISNRRNRQTLITKTTTNKFRTLTDSLSYLTQTTAHRQKQQTTANKKDTQTTANNNKQQTTANNKENQRPQKKATMPFAEKDHKIAQKARCRCYSWWR